MRAIWLGLLLHWGAASAQTLSELRARSLECTAEAGFRTFDCFRFDDACTCFYLTDNYKQGVLEFCTDNPTPPAGQRLGADAAPRSPLRRHLRHLPKDDPELHLYGLFGYTGGGYRLFYTRETTGPDVLHRIDYTARGRFTGKPAQGERLRK